MYYLEPKKDHRTQSTRENIEVSSAGLLQDIVQHYDDCYSTYSYWCNEDNLAYHYGYWDSIEPYDHHQSLFNMNAYLYEKAGIKPTDKVLDAGCGIGGSSIWMAKNHHNKVTGITLSAKQVEHAQKNAQRHHVSDLTHFEVADFCATPFADESFDIVWALESSCYALDKSAFLKEAYRLLCKGGRLVIGDAFMLQRELNEQQWQAVVAFYNGWAVPNLCMRDEFNQYLIDLKFQNIQIRNINEQIRPSAKYIYKVTKRFFFWGKLAKCLGLSSKAKEVDAQVGFAQHEFFRVGGIAEYFVATAGK